MDCHSSGCHSFCYRKGWELTLCYVVHGLLHICLGAQLDEAAISKAQHDASAAVQADLLKCRRLAYTHFIIILCAVEYDVLIITGIRSAPAK